MKEINANFIEERCPLCKSQLLSDGEFKYCSFVGISSLYPKCKNGIENKIRVNDSYSN